MFAARSEARYATIGATFFGSRICGRAPLTRVRPRSARSAVAASGTVAVMRVAADGQMELAVMPYLPRSRAACG